VSLFGVAHSTHAVVGFKIDGQITRHPHRRRRRIYHRNRLQIGAVSCALENTALDLLPGTSGSVDSY
jgi:hypothetical protein